MMPALRDGTPLCKLDSFQSAPHAWPKLWKHHGAKAAVDRINAVARERKESFLARYGGTIGIEWFFPKMLEILTDRAAKQEQIDSAFLTETDKLRAFYLSRIKEEAAAAELAGHGGQAAALRAAGAEASGNEAWLRSFGIEPRPEAPSFSQEK